MHPCQEARGPSARAKLAASLAGVYREASAGSASADRPAARALQKALVLSLTVGKKEKMRRLRSRACLPRHGCGSALAR